MNLECFYQEKKGVAAVVVVEDAVAVEDAAVVGDAVVVEDVVAEDDAAAADGVVAADGVAVGNGGFEKDDVAAVEEHDVVAEGDAVE